MAVRKRLRRFDEAASWVVASVNMRKVRRPSRDTADGYSKNKRLDLCLGIWHIAQEHAMSIAFLIEAGQHGSALALVRPTFEAYVRGFWLATTATDEQVDEAGRDNFPRRFFEKMVADIEQPGRLPKGALSHLKGKDWSKLCSYTHGGYQQIGARLTPEGFGYAYEEAELLWSINVAEWLLLLTTIGIGPLLGDEDLSRAALERIREGKRQSKDQRTRAARP